MTWRPISEHDKSSDELIVCAQLGDNGKLVAAAHYHIERKEWWWANTDYGDYLACSLKEQGFTVTHFQPYPEPPE